MGPQHVTLEAGRELARQGETLCEFQKGNKENQIAVCRKLSEDTAYV